MHRRLWAFPIVGALAGFVLYLPFLYVEHFDLESIGYILFLILLTVVLCVGIVLRRFFVKRWVSLRPVLVVLGFWGISALMFVSTDRLRPWARWLVASRHYTSLVLKQQADPKTGLRYAEWDGWGWAGMDTSVELVYDPTDTLGCEIRHNPKGRFAELAEKTAFVQRLGPGWYSLTLYTGEGL
jgi:hypothetical protein